MWLSGCRFVFNFYTHWAILIIRSSSRADFAATLLSQEGVTQGCPLAIVAFGLGLMPLIRRLKEELPTVHQPWYADDAAAASSFSKIREFMNFLEKHGPSYSYWQLAIIVGVFKWTNCIASSGRPPINW
jgi:hypothetical protein